MAIKIIGSIASSNNDVANTTANKIVTIPIRNVTGDAIIKKNKTVSPETPK